MAKRNRKPHPTWTNVKAKLDSFDRAGLLGLVQNLYTAQADTRTFLHARFGLAEDVLLPDKRTIEQWLYPHVFGKEDISVSKATKAISDYKKAVDQPEGLTELMVFLREVATDFCDEFGMQDEGDFGALVRMFEQAAELANTLPPSSRDGFVARLNRVRLVSHNLGYGVGAEIDFLLSECDFAEPSPTSRSLPAWRWWPVACSRCPRRSCRSSNHASIFRPDSL